MATLVAQRSDITDIFFQGNELGHDAFKLHDHSIYEPLHVTSFSDIYLSATSDGISTPKLERYCDNGKQADQIITQQWLDIDINSVLLEDSSSSTGFNSIQSGLQISSTDYFHSSSNQNNYLTHDDVEFNSGPLDTARFGSSNDPGISSLDVSLISHSDYLISPGALDLSHNVTASGTQDMISYEMDTHISSIASNPVPRCKPITPDNNISILPDIQCQNHNLMYSFTIPDMTITVSSQLPAAERSLMPGVCVANEIDDTDLYKKRPTSFVCLPPQHTGAIISQSHFYGEIPQSDVNQPHLFHSKCTSIEPKKEQKLTKPSKGKRGQTCMEKNMVETILKDTSGNVVGTFHVSGPQKRPRIPYSTEDKERISVTRSIGACSRCKRLKMKCLRESPYKQCAGCVSSTRSRRLTFVCFPLSLDKPEIAELFRKGPSQKHPHYVYTSRQDLYCFTDPTSSAQDHIVLQLTQDLGEELTVSVTSYEPHPGENTGHSWKHKGQTRTLNMPPYRIANLEEVRRAMENYIGRFKRAFYGNLSKHSNEVICEILENARRFSFLSKNTTVDMALDLLAINRIIEWGWSICGKESLGISIVSETGCPWFGTIPITPIMDTQLDQIVIKLFLQPLRAKLLQQLQEEIYGNKRENWFEIFLTTSILLINAEWLLRHSRSRAIQYGTTNRYISLERAASYFHSCNIFITHFHYLSNGATPLSLNWDSVDDPVVAVLNIDQRSFMRRIQHKIKANKDHVLDLRKNHRYEDELYWCHQLFFPNWQPDAGGIKDDISVD